MEDCFFLSDSPLEGSVEGCLLLLVHAFLIQAILNEALSFYENQQCLTFFVNTPLYLPSRGESVFWAYFGENKLKRLIKT
ncbi:hypothetical protein EFB08_22630 [Rufibacter latericius]|uniref:Uncharacterized protein n=1 Tax=Rufibacter latericius TaxID=2487040 RepID=A0A3M9M8P8_9BACT|nr:hypothetical protein EFB08_22630 [Rufibacter latericius]